MKKTPNKRDIRRQIEQQMLDYLERGGEVVKVEKGTSAYHPGSGPETILFQEPKQARTAVGDVVSQLESRRRPDKTRGTQTRPARPRKVPLYDDFGEIIRWVWRDDDGQNNQR